MDLDSRNVLSEKKHLEECIKPFVPPDFVFDLQLFGGDGKSGGKILAGIVGFAVGMFFPAAFGVAANSLAWTSSAIAAGVMGASLFSTVWSVATMSKNENDESSVNIQRFDRAQESMSYGGNIPVIYGMRKVSGNQTYHQTDAEQQKLHKHIVLCEGGIQGLQSVSANDLLIPTGGQTSNTVFTLQNVKYPDASCSLNDKVLTLYANGQARQIRLYNKDDLNDNPDLAGTLWEWQTSISALISYINRLGDGWQAFPTATTCLYPADMSMSYNPRTVHVGEMKYNIDHGRGDNCALPTVGYFTSVGFGGEKIDGYLDESTSIWGRSSKGSSLVTGKLAYSGWNFSGWEEGNEAKSTAPQNLKTNRVRSQIYRNAWGRFLRVETKLTKLPPTFSYRNLKLVENYRTDYIYVYDLWGTVDSGGCYMNPVNFNCATVVGGTSYSFHDCEPPSNYEEVGGYPNMAWLDMNFVVSNELNGNPTVSCIVQGKKVLNLKTGAVEYSTNPAWCLRDFITSKRYGLGKWFSDSDIDRDSWIKAADYCDEIITFHNSDGSEERAKRYELNMVIDAKRSAMDWLQEILANFCGYLVYSEGKIKLKIERPERVSYKFNDSNCFNLSVAPLHLSEVPNQYKVKFIDPMNNWSSVVALCEDLSDLKLRQRLVTKEVSLEGVTSQHQALRLARFYRDYNLVCPLNVSFTTGQQAMHLEPGDVVTIDYHGVFKDLPIRITQIQETEKGEFEIQGRQYNDTIYTDDLGGGIHWYNYSTEQSPLVGAVPPPVNLRLAETGYESDSGKWVDSVTAKWDSPAYNFIGYYEVSYSYDNHNFLSCGSTKENHFVIPNTHPWGRIYVRVVMVNTANRSSGAVENNIVLKGKNTPPEPISEFVVAQYNSEMDFIMSGQIPNDADFDRVELRMDGSEWSKAKPICFFTDFPFRLRNVDIPEGEHIFRVKSVDTNGNTSAEDSTYTLEVRNGNTFKNIVLSRDDMETGEYELEGLMLSENGNIIDPWNITFEDSWTKTFDDWWDRRMDCVDSTGKDSILDMFDMDFSDVWDNSFDDDMNYESVFY